MDKKLIVMIGAQRSGKSYLSNALLEQYIKRGGCGIVANLGKPSDFAAAQEVLAHGAGFETLQGKKHTWRNFVRKGRAVKFSALDKADSERFLGLFADYCAQTLLILDDARFMFRSGLTKAQIALFGRLNHVGLRRADRLRAKGSDCIVILHSLEDSGLDDLMSYATDLCVFRTETEPQYSRIKNPYLRRVLELHFRKLYEAPKYSYLKIDLKNGICKLVKNRQNGH